ncbi:hypothetical protein JKF63_07246 [Porcisia hertigi]|uniref:Uncharacterized protein n=1 Tax=Porcisia hertigi TaxID=2761500 RepID=A0A836YHM8_9TRYP|nr:hypothetical protein JKF63_07246 [Porcisia hertigi]
MAGVPLPWRQFTIVPGQNIDPLLLCPLCHDPWIDPVELEPCGDICCKQCIDAARAQQAARPRIVEALQCPICQTAVQREKQPNRVLLNAVMRVEVECQYCHWRGSRESSEHHHTCEEVNRAGQKQQSPSTAPTSVEWFVSADAITKPDIAVDEAQPSRPLLSRPPTNYGGPRRAQHEIEDGYTPIGDNPTWTTVRANCISSPGEGAGTLFKDTPAETTSASCSDHISSPPRLPPAGVAANPSEETAYASNQGGGGSGLHTNRSPVVLTSTYSQDLLPHYGLSQIDCDQLIGVFMMFDDDTGQLNRTQLRDLCVCMNFVQRDEDMDTIFSSMDRGRKGYVSQDDFITWFSRHQPDPSSLFGLSRFEYMDAILQFRAADPEYKGLIDASRFRALCLTYKHVQTPEQAMQYYRLCDPQHTGYVSLRQFLQTLKSMKISRNENVDAHD